MSFNAPNRCTRGLGNLANLAVSCVSAHIPQCEPRLERCATGFSLAAPPLENMVKASQQAQAPSFLQGSASAPSPRLGDGSVCRFRRLLGLAIGCLQQQATSTGRSGGVDVGLRRGGRAVERCRGVRKPQHRRRGGLELLPSSSATPDAVACLRVVAVHPRLHREHALRIVLLRGRVYVTAPPFTISRQALGDHVSPRPGYVQGARRRNTACSSTLVHTLHIIPSISSAASGTTTCRPLFRCLRTGKSAHTTSSRIVPVSGRASTNNNRRRHLQIRSSESCPCLPSSPHTC